MRAWHVRVLIVTAAILTTCASVRAQSFGVETHNTLMPASGGMAGASLAMPQDLTSAINGNPATLTQFYGTQFLFGGAWAEPTYNLSHQQGLLPTLGTFSAKSEAQGSLLGNIGVTQDFSALGIPATMGLGFVSSAGGLVDFRDVPESNGTNTTLTVFELVPAVGVDVTDRLSLGASIQTGIAFFDGPFVGIGGETLDYGLRGTLGANYKLNSRTTVGGYWQTKQSFTFDNAIRLRLADGNFTTVQDISMDLPENVGFGIANNSLLGGDLLLALDVLYKQWGSADLYRALYTDQWVAQHSALLPTEPGWGVSGTNWYASLWRPASTATADDSLVQSRRPQFSIYGFYPPNRPALDIDDGIIDDGILSDTAHSFLQN